MRRSGLVVLLLVAGCNLEPLADPGLGDAPIATRVLAADGSLLAEFHVDEYRSLVRYADLPQALVDAVVSIEDRRFWTHGGVDLRASLRALEANLEAGEVVEGGSTITQQYIKNVLLSPEVTLERKLAEAVLALRVEETLTKEQILERYLNTVYFGHASYGVGVAARTYFGKDVSELSLSDSASLAGLIAAPSASDPLLHPERALARRNLVLRQMAEEGYLTQAAAAAAEAEPLQLQGEQRWGAQFRFAYFVTELERQLLDDPRLGTTATDRFNALYRGGLTVHTTLDPLIQTAAEAAVADVIGDEGPAAALVAIEPRTGAVRALVGGRDFYDPASPVAQFNLATQAHRQPGSAFKPFVLAAALESGIGLDAIIAGGESISILGSDGIWTVENFDKAVFPDLTLLEATVFSVNVAYARLIHGIGAAPVVDLAHRAGITSQLDVIESLALGTEEVSLFEITSAYGTFAAQGVQLKPTLISQIRFSDGRVLFEETPTPVVALRPETAADVTKALTEVVQRGTGQSARFGRPVAGKSGTSQSHRDAWFVGYTPELVAGVWVGFPDGYTRLEMPNTPYTVTGGTWPAQIFSRFATKALADRPHSQLPLAPSEDLVSVEVDLATGFLAGPMCPRRDVLRLELPAEQAPTVVCPVHNPAGIVADGTIVVPGVIGHDLAAAVTELERLGFEIGVGWESRVGAGPAQVLGQSPSAGFPAQIGSLVSLKVNGPEAVTTVPSLLGLSAEQAVSLLAAIGAEPRTIVETEPSDVAAQRSGIVWKQQPAAQTPAAEGVTIWVNP